MRQQLIQYVNLLFAGCPNCEDIRQEILQNTLDRYDDLIAEGKVPEAAYRLAISGIGDINEILGTIPTESPSPAAAFQPADAKKAIRLRAIGIALYILCPVPLFALSVFSLEVLGLCLLLVLVAAATVLMIVTGRNDTPREKQFSNTEHFSPQQELRKSITTLIRTATLICFLAVSLITGAWFATWLIFPLGAAVRGLAFAVLDLKEATDL